MHCPGKILVHLHNGGLFKAKNKIIHNQGLNIKQQINNDANQKPILKEGGCQLYLSANNNDNVIVVDKTGSVRFRYYRTPAREILRYTSKRNMAYASRGIVINQSNPISRAVVKPFNILYDM